MPIELLNPVHLVDLALACIALEALVLLRLRSRIMPEVTAGALLANLASGACLLIALRSGLSGASWPWIIVPLTGSLIAHATDLASRIGQQRRR